MGAISIRAAVEVRNGKIAGYLRRQTDARRRADNGGAASVRCAEIVCGQCADRRRPATSAHADPLAGIAKLHGRVVGVVEHIPRAARWIRAGGKRRRSRPEEQGKK